jgi:hypothetical protein
LDADKSGNLYASNCHGFVYVYAPGNSVPSYRLFDNGGTAWSVAVCPNGNIFVGNFQQESGPGDVAEFAGGQRSPTSVVPLTDAYNVFGVACDDNSVLWISYDDQDSGMHIAAFDGTTVTDYGSLGIAFVGAVRVTGTGDLVVASQPSQSNPNPSVEFFNSQNLAAGPYLTISVPDVSGFSLIPSLKDIWVADGDAVEFNLRGNVRSQIGGGIVVGAFDVYAFPPGNT